MILLKYTVKHILILITALTLGGCNRYQASQVILSEDPEAAARAALKHRVQSYEHNPVALVQDIRSVRRDFNRLVTILRGDVGKVWGDREIRLPDKKHYVKYTDNYRSRAIVDFDQGQVTVETIQQPGQGHYLQNAIVTTLLTPDDPRSVDLYSSRRIKLSGRPYLQGLVLDQHQREIRTPQQAEAFARYLVQNQQSKRTISTPAGPRLVRRVRFPLVNDYINRSARRYAGLVKHYAASYQVSRSLVYAIIKTESGFNPYAVSSAPAYGLMQLVPATGGRDAFRRVKGYDHTPSKQYLFNPGNNIELGTAYLSIIDRNYLGAIRDPVSREYCTIAAYNAGSGNVLRTFSSDRDRAVRIINSLPATEVYQRLRNGLAQQEARRYLVKVLHARREFVSL
jgi:membrane-bound lytic murein transglycosylase C